MDIASLLSRPSLANYLSDNDKQNNTLLDIAELRASGLASQQATNASITQSEAVQVDLSPEAQALLAQQSSAGDLYTAAQKHFLKFFEDNNIDMDNLSEDALGLIDGILEIISGSETTDRDLKTDNLELSHSKGKRDVFTLTGENHRLRIAIEDQTDGKQKLTITDVSGNQVDIAEITLDRESQDSISININRMEEKYAFGAKAESNIIDSLKIRTPALV